MKRRLAIVTTHPIQYYAPLFRLMSGNDKIQIRVFYTWGKQSLTGKYDPDFGKKIEWDIPLLEGYEYEFLNNVGADPGSHHFKGIENPDIIERINDFKPHAILVIGWSFKSHLAVMRHYKGRVPVLFRGDSTLLDHTSWYKKLLRTLFLTWVYRHVDYALYVGKSNYDYFIQHGLKPGQLIFAPHAIDNERFGGLDDNCGKNAMTLRQELGITNDQVVFLFVGKLEEKKDPLFLVNTFLKAALPSAHLVLVGSGVLLNTLKAAALNQTSVHFLPFQNQSAMPAVYKMSDVIILPSKGPNETWGLCINEAMAGSRAVIVSDKCGCAANLVSDEKNGFVFKAQNEIELAQCIKWMSDNRHRLKDMGIHSKKIIQEYSFERIVNETERLVNMLPL